MDLEFGGITVTTWIVSGAVFCIVAFGIPMVRGMIARRCAGASVTDRTWRGLVGCLNVRWMRVTTLTVALVVAILLLSPDARVIAVCKVVVILVLAIQLIRLVSVVVDWLLVRVAQARGHDGSAESALAMLTGLRWLGLFTAYSIILLLALQNMGVDVTSLVAGLGIGGIAVALALQNVLGDLFASLTITLDKPFVIGDFIVVGTDMGTIEHVGLKTTRVRSLSGEQLVFGNADLLSSRIRNYKRMTERRVVFGFGVVYGTSPDTIEEISVLVRGAIEKLSKARFDRCHLHRFGDSSLDFEVVYYINSPDYNEHMDVQQAVHLSIMRAFHDRGIEFAFPTQVLYMARTEGRSGAVSANGRGSAAIPPRRLNEAS